MATTKIPRRQLILEALAQELERNPGGRITTAALARAAGISEAALYRHFPSKAKMFEELISFAEETIFSRVNQLIKEEHKASVRCEHILYLLLGFSTNNPGITRVLLGDALVGEREQLMVRVEQFFSRLETQLRLILREGNAREEGNDIAAEVGANLMLAYVEGRMHQFHRSRFAVAPLDQWEAQWKLLQSAVFHG